MSRSLRLGLIALLLALTVWPIAERREGNRLDQALVQERKRAVETAWLGSENPALAKAIAQLTKIRQTRRKLQEAEASAQTLDRRDPSPDGYLGVEDLKDRGNATVHDAFETYLWALDHLDTEALAQILYLPKELRLKLDTFLAALPPEEQARYGSAASVFALIYAAQDRPTYYSGLEVVSPEPTPGTAEANLAKIQVNYEYSDGRVRTHTGGYALPSNAGWKIFEPDSSQVLDQFLGNGGGNPK
jgi:hypothetical protein